MQKYREWNYRLPDMSFTEEYIAYVAEEPITEAEFRARLREALVLRRLPNGTYVKGIEKCKKN